MVYLFAILGLVFGFFFGVGVIGLFLRQVSKKELQTNKSLWWTYGLAVWIFAGLGAYSGILLHDRYF
ncbi:MAG: hypothetical protein AAF988_02660 [Pseudomonadota bacterium]